MIKHYTKELPAKKVTGVSWSQKTYAADFTYIRGGEKAAQTLPHERRERGDAGRDPQEHAEAGGPHISHQEEAARGWEEGESDVNNGGGTRRVTVTFQALPRSRMAQLTLIL